MRFRNADKKLLCTSFSYKNSTKIVLLIYHSCFRSQHRHARCLLIALVGLFLLAACNHKDWFPQPKEQMTPVEVSGFGHLGPGWGVPSYYVNGVGGGNSSGVGGGGSFSCCVSIPSKWREGLIAKVNWETCDIRHMRFGIDGLILPEDKDKKCILQHYEKILPIPYYDEPGTLRVHFFPDGIAAIVVSSHFLGNPKYPWPDLPGYYDLFIYQETGLKFKNSTNKEMRK